MMAARIMVIDDEEGIRDLIKRALAKSLPRASILTLDSARGAFQAASFYRPHLVILDWVLAGSQSGLHLCRHLKLNPATRKTSVLIISGQRLEDHDKLESIAYGGDAYLGKPFKLEKLTEYCKVLIRKNRIAKTPSSDMIQIKNLILNRKERQICASYMGARRCPPKLFKLLWLLAKHYPKTVPVTHLIRHVWKNNVRDAEAAVAVSRLKKLLDPRDCTIEAVAGRRGYRLALSV